MLCVLVVGGQWSEEGGVYRHQLLRHPGRAARYDTCTFMFFKFPKLCLISTFLIARALDFFVCVPCVGCINDVKNVLAFITEHYGFVQVGDLLCILLSAINIRRFSIFKHIIYIAHGFVQVTTSIDGSVLVPYLRVWMLSPSLLF